MDRLHLSLLLITSQPATQQQIEELLRQQEAVIVDLRIAESLSSGLKMLDKKPCDVLLVDLDLADRQGLDSLIGLSNRIHQYPVIVVTAIPYADLGLKALRLGVQDYLTRDHLTSDALIKSICHAYYRKRSEHTLQTTQQLKADLDKERSLRAMQEHFLEMVEDQFRTPLTIIVTSATLLEIKSDRMNDQQRANHLKQIASSALTMNNVLDNILSVTLAQNNQLSFSPTRLNIHLFCHDIVKAFREKQSGKHDIILQTEGEQFEGYFDGSLMGQILTNLLSNAIKFSPPYTQVTVSLEISNNHLILKVKDQGSGISEADRPHIFDLFYQGKSGYVAPGLGIGLTIVKQAVELHQGLLAFETIVGEGTTFVVQLPINIKAR